MKKQITPKYGLCIDWETSGALWGGDSSSKYQGLSFGAVVFDTQTFTPIETLYKEIKFNPGKWDWSNEAEAIHGLSREYLDENGVEAEDAAIELAELILKYWGPDSKVMFLGHNAEYDIRFTNQLLNVISIEFSVERKTACEAHIELHHVILDTSSTGFITLGLFKSDLLFDRIGFTERGAHNALEDALQTVQTCAVIRTLVNSALE